MPCSSGELGRAGTHGGLQTTSAARPSGKRSASRTSTCFAEAEALDVLARAGERARIQVRRDHALHAAPREHGGEHAGAGADVERDESSRSAAGSGAFATRSTYSLRIGANTP